MSDQPQSSVPAATPPPHAADTAQPASAQPNAITPDQAKLDELRRLLLNPEQEQIAQIQTQLSDHRTRVNELSRLLPDAIRARNERDAALTTALKHNIGPALKEAIKKDSATIVGALLPLIGPLIRRLITQTLNEFVQTIDESMKHNFTPQGLRWRFEALTTRRPFAEVVMYHTLVYRIEQALLFHKKSGLLLHHEALPHIATQDADMISGLLTVINDFAHESFKTSQEQSLLKLDYGELEVWLEGGVPPFELAYLAVVINGNAPEGLRTNVLQPALEEIHQNLREELLNFDGDTNVFELTQPQLERCLQTHFHGKSPVTEAPQGFRLPPVIAVPLACLLVLLSVWGFFSWRAQRHWNAYLQQLQAQPGLVVTEQHRNSNWFGARFTVEGLRDPLAVDPASLLASAQLTPGDVTSQWKPFHSLDPQFVAERARLLLEAPPSVKLRAENGVLYLTGEAPQQWLTQARALVRALPGVTQLNTDALLTAEFKEQLKLKEEIERSTILFMVGTTQLAPGQTPVFQTVTRQIQRLVALAAISGKQPQLEITGHTDTEGSAEFNQRLSQQRADLVFNTLTKTGVPRERLTTRAAGTTIPLRLENTNEDKQFNRRTSFRIEWRS